MRNGERLKMRSVLERPQTRHQRVLVAWRQERAQKNEIRNPARNRGDGARSRVDRLELGADVARDVVQDARLQAIRLNNENQAHAMTFSINTTKMQAATRNVTR